MTDKSVIIIGAGLAGLSAGCYCQMNDYHTHIFEHHTVPGGVAACWRRKGYLVDGGIHFLIGHRPGSQVYEMYRELGATRANRFLDMETYGIYVDENSGRQVAVTTDLDRLALDLKSFSSADGRAIDELISGARALQRFDLSGSEFGRPSELNGPLAPLKRLWEMRSALKYFGGKYGKPVHEYTRTFQDPWLRAVVENLFLPEVPVWFAMMLLGMLGRRQLGLLENGSLGFVLPIERRYKSLGGTVTYKATVEKILVEDDRAVGVRLADGSEHTADYVLSAADGYSTIFEMLDGRYADEKIKQRYATWQLFRPFVTISFGVAREFPDEPPFAIIALKKPFAVGNQLVPWISVRTFNYSPAFAPAGKTVIQVEFESEWDYWNELRSEDRAGYDAEKERVAADILHRLEDRHPGISSQVEMVDVATPFTTWRYTRNYRGSYEGWLPTPRAIVSEIKRTLPGLKNLYLAGQWVVPGGGVPTCLYSGRHAAEILCGHDRKPFVATTP